MTNVFHIYTHTCADSLILLVVLIDVFSFLKSHAFSIWSLGPMIWWSVVYDGRARSHLLGNLLKPIVIIKTSSIQITVNHDFSHELWEFAEFAAKGVS